LTPGICAAPQLFAQFAPDIWEHVNAAFLACGHLNGKRQDVETFKAACPERHRDEVCRYVSECLLTLSKADMGKAARYAWQQADSATAEDQIAAHGKMLSFVLTVQQFRQWQQGGREQAPEVIVNRL
jgi:hypothetical protein